MSRSARLSCEPTGFVGAIYLCFEIRTRHCKLAPVSSQKGRDEDCTTELQVLRNTIYEAIPGQQLRIECPVKFCNILPPPVFWYKFEGKNVHLIDNNTNHIEIQWESDLLKGKSYLIFQYITSSDSGGYQCESEGSVSHTIYINVNGDNNGTKTTKSTSETSITEVTTTTSLQLRTSAPDMFWHYLYRVLGIGVFLLIIISICATSEMVLKGRYKKTADPCPSKSSDQIYENV